MSLRLTLDLLAPGLRTASLSVPVSRTDPGKGWAMITVKEIPKLEWDELWAALQQAEKSTAVALRNLLSESPQHLAKLQEAERTAIKAILQRALVGHEASDFETMVPVLAPDSPDYARVLSTLLKAGVSAEVAAAALVSGVCPTPFVLNEKGVVSDATLDLYDRLSPEREFAVNICAMINMFQCGYQGTAGDIWRSAKVEESKIPAPFAKPPEMTST